MMQGEARNIRGQRATRSSVREQKKKRACAGGPRGRGQK